MNISELSYANLIFFTGAITTLIVTPALTYDPINVPKMSVLVIGSSIIFAILILNLKKLTDSPIYFRLLLSIFLLGIILNLLLAESRFTLKFYGEWGRSTGALTYFSFAILILASCNISKNGRDLIIKNFLRLSYLISSYTAIQYLELDPIDWTIDAPVATLGNINFMSAFLGLTSILMFNFVVFKGSKVSERLHFSFWTLFNLFLIFISGSIQGLVMFFAGASTLIIFIMYTKHKKYLALFSGVALSSVGIVSALGSGGQGPLGNLLYQPTVMFRIDYWKAGIAIFQSSPLIGRGLDSYGEYYRQFRDLTAVLRTGPQRITNTAHNVFIDLLSGGGIIVGGSFLILFLLVVIKIAKLKVINEAAIFEKGLFLSALFSLFVFLNISINQIGVGVWAMIIIGLSVSMIHENTVNGSRQLIEKRVTYKDSGRSKKTPNRKINIIGQRASDFQSDSHVRKISATLIFLFFATAVWSVYVPLRSDRVVLTALRSSDDQLLLQVVKKATGTTNYQDLYLDKLLETGREKEAVALAENFIKENPRQYFAWTVLALSNYSIERRDEAVAQLSYLDPMNRGLLSDLEKSWAASEGASK